MAVEIVPVPTQSPFTFTKCGLAPIGEPTREEILTCFDFIKNADASIHWWIGDLLNYTESKYGEMYKEIEDLTGFAYDTLARDKSISHKIEICRRRQNLSFGHHVEVAAYTPQEQEILLERAEELGLSIRQFRLKKDSLLPKGVQPGSWWKLGQHLLYCGDSSSDDFKSKVKETQAAFAFADPPYNAGVDVWDSGFEWKHDYLAKTAPIVAVTPGISAIKDFMRTTEMPYKWSMSYWINNGMTRGALGFGNWMYVALFSEQSLYRNEQDLERIDIDEQWDKEAVSITGGDKDPLKHKGRKPINLMKHIVEMFTKQGETIIDPFLGTGTTLIASELTGRVCVGAEMSVEYCESIIKRWERLTEKTAEEIKNA